ncbi:hypothetical protein TNCV_4966601 [Trichonephila clavipes]|nr:hypothetical protein TNCV_4966601 [Trichonephila clavipes]
MKTAGWSTRAVLLTEVDRSSLLLEIIGSSGHEKVSTRRNQGLERPGRPRGERIEDRAASKQDPQDSFNDTSRHWSSNVSTNNFQKPSRSKS